MPVPCIPLQTPTWMVLQRVGISRPTFFFNTVADGMNESMLIFYTPF